MDIFNKSAEFLHDVVSEIASSRRTEDYLGIEAVKKTAIELGVITPQDSLPISDEVRHHEINELEAAIKADSADAVTYPLQEEVKSVAPGQIGDPANLVRDPDELREMRQLEDEARRLTEAAHQPKVDA